MTARIRESRILPRLAAALFAAVPMTDVPPGLPARPPVSAAQAPSASKTWFPNLIDNGGFESYSPMGRPGAWRADPAGLFLWDEFSRGDGGRSVFIDASRIPGDAPAGRASLSCALAAIRPGATYLLEIALLRDKAVDGVYPSVSLFGEERRLDDFWTAGKWRLLPVFFKAPRGRLSESDRLLTVKIPRGDYRLWLDDLSLREFRILSLSPGDGAVVRPESGGAVDFYWEMPETDRLIDVSLVLFPESPASPGAPFPRESGAHLFSAANLRDSRRISVPASALTPGSWSWRLEARQYRRILATSASRLLSLEPPAAAAGRPAAVPGPAFSPARTAAGAPDFPIGVYGAEPEDFVELKDAGFNAVVFLSRDPVRVRTAAEAAARDGLRIMLSPNPGLAAGLRASDILGWYLADEPEGRGESPKDVFLKRRAIREAGFGRPGAIALNRSWRAPDYASAVDVFMPDPYPVPFEPLSWIAECLDDIRSAVSGDAAKRVWPIIQAFPWSADAGPDSPAASARPPGSGEIRAMTQVALIHGADGLFYYTYRSGAYRIRDHQEIWEGIKGAVREVRGNLAFWISPTVDFGPRTIPLGWSPEAAPRVKMTCDASDPAGWPAIHYVLKSLGPGGLRLLAVNTLDRPVRASWAWAGRSGEAVFAPFESKIFELRD